MESNSYDMLDDNTITQMGSHLYFLRIPCITVHNSNKKSQLNAYLTFFKKKIISYRENYALVMRKVKMNHTLLEQLWNSYRIYNTNNTNS